jgi:hypothetical protein
MHIDALEKPASRKSLKEHDEEEDDAEETSSLASCTKAASQTNALSTDSNPPSGNLIYNIKHVDL